MRHLTWQQRYYSKIKDIDNGCWEWTCCKDKNGYGVLTVQGKKKKAHRLALELNGFNIDGYLVLHKCDNPSCVNPLHLSLGTQTENMRDMALKDRGSIKITKEDAEEIRLKYATGNYVLADLALEYEITFQHVSAIVRRKRRVT